LVRRLEDAAQFCLSTVPTAVQHYFLNTCMWGSGLMETLLANFGGVLGKDRSSAAPDFDALFSAIQPDVEALDRHLKGLLRSPGAAPA
jgi:hypothetical protein